MALGPHRKGTQMGWRVRWKSDGKTRYRWFPHDRFVEAASFNLYITQPSPNVIQEQKENVVLRSIKERELFPARQGLTVQAVHHLFVDQEPTVYNPEALSTYIRQMGSGPAADRLGPQLLPMVEELETKALLWDSIGAGEDAHLLTVGSPSKGLCLRVCRGSVSKDGIWHPNRLEAFLIWRGKRVGGS